MQISCNVYAVMSHKLCFRSTCRFAGSWALHRGCNDICLTLLHVIVSYLTSCMHVRSLMKSQFQVCTASVPCLYGLIYSTVVPYQTHVPYCHFVKNHMVPTVVLLLTEWWL